MRASSRGPGDVFPGDRVVDEAGLELLCLSGSPPDRCAADPDQPPTQRVTLGQSLSLSATTYGILTMCQALSGTLGSQW